MNALLLRPVLATAAIALCVLGFEAWSWQLERVHLASVPLPALGHSVDIEVVLPFQPEAFNIQRLQEAGRMVRIEGDRAWLRAVSAAQLRALARLYWVSRIEPWNGS